MDREVVSGQELIHSTRLSSISRMMFYVCMIVCMFLQYSCSCFISSLCCPSCLCSPSGAFPSCPLLCTSGSASKNVLEQDDIIYGCLEPRPQVEVEVEEFL